MGPFYDAHDNERLQDFDENIRPCIAPIAINDEDGGNEANVAMAEELKPRPFAIEEAIVKKLKLGEIREELRKRKQPTIGLRAVLLACLRQAMLDEAPVYAESDLAPPPKKANKKAKAGVYDLPEDSWWKMLETHSSVVEPKNSRFKQPRAPTINAEEAKYVPQKFNFAETFEQPQFEGVVETEEKNRNGTTKKDRNGAPVFKSTVRHEGLPDPDFLSKHSLTTSSEPKDFLEVFFPFEENIYSTAKNECITIKQLTKVKWGLFCRYVSLVIKLLTIIFLLF